MKVDRKELALALAMTPGIGGKTLTRIMAHNDLMHRGAEGMLRLSAEGLREEYRLTAKVAERLAASGMATLRSVRPLRDRLESLGVSLVTAADASYPSLVEAFDPDPPGVLFLYGNLKLLEAKTFCVLSSRNTSRAGLDLVERLAEERVLAGETLVGGHDTPEYQRSAVVPLRWGAPRVLCFDRGLFQALGSELQDEPFRAARLWRFRFDPKTDLAISPFRPEAKFIGVNNQVRDRLIASLSHRLEFVEVKPGGNMERLARMASKAGREVRLVGRDDASALP